jgi:RNA polymerase II subunit A-like phosphatase
MSTELYLPTSLPFPIKILSISLQPPTEISRGTNLLSYSYVHCDKPTPDEPEPEPEVRYGTWDSPIEGAIDKWNIRSGDTVSAKQAKGKPVLFVNEPCKHGMQLGGLCCLCGKDMTECVPLSSNFHYRCPPACMRHHSTSNPRLNA